jgi:hypothetical protein
LPRNTGEKLREFVIIKFGLIHYSNGTEEGSKFFYDE